MKKIFKNNQKNLICAVIASLVFGFVFLNSAVKIYGQLENLPTKVKVQGDSIVGSKINVKTEDQEQSLPTNTELWEKINPQIAQNAKNLASKYGHNWNSNAILPSENIINPDNKPEGQIWIRSGDLNINSSIQINGKATFIIIGGNLNINASLTYADTNSSIGFIILDDNVVGKGNIVIGKNVNNLHGAYYATKKITFKYNE